jgi:heme A synthase
MREHRFAIATAFATFVLLVVGSLVHGTGSSLACPDWPLCYGTFFPKMENGVQYEHTHRIVATAVGTMTVVLAALLLRRKERRLFRLGAIAVGLVIFQGILGGITVLYQLPRPISIAHLATSMCFFSLTIVIALRTSPSLPSAVSTPPNLRPWLAATWGLVLAQIVLGGLVRHTASGLACLDVPLCHGVPWPDKAPERVQMIHRAGAVVVGAAVVAVSLWLRQKSRATPWLRRLALLPIGLVALQIGLGVESVLSLLDLATITTHLAVGAALLGSLVVLFELSPRAHQAAERAVAESSSSAVALS